MTGIPAGFRPAKRPVPGRYWKLATLSGMASYLDSGLLIAISVSLAIWRDSFGMGVWMAGAMSAIVTFCIAIGSLIGGRLADLFGRPGRPSPSRRSSHRRFSNTARGCCCGRSPSVR
ncbi:hypothetical protein [Streptomyces sp. GMR22]|uniref:hypothetical protein n=1 Tax=Streptomyces sp. GMR22 TaxID=2759524 RepID=UPI003FA34C53